MIVKAAYHCAKHFCFALLVSLLFVVTTGAAFAQTTVQLGAAKTSDEKKPETKELTDEQKNIAQLDAILLGSWVYLAPGNATNVTDKQGTEAAQRCLVGNSGAGANQGSTTAGDLTFFRTAQGLQVVDTKAGRVYFFPELLKQDNGLNGLVWGLKNGQLIRDIRFTEMNSAIGKINLLLDKNAIYMRCQSVLDAARRN